MSIHVAQRQTKALNNEIMLDGSSIAGFEPCKPRTCTSPTAVPSRYCLESKAAQDGPYRVRHVQRRSSPFEGCRTNNLQARPGRRANWAIPHNVGPELEFSSLRKTFEPPLPWTPMTVPAVTIWARMTWASRAFEIVETLENLGFDMEADHHEVAAQGQHD
ncbi:MAG: hypothetical protein R2857_00240 [Vampirovibrionales bacterium]